MKNPTAKAMKLDLMFASPSEGPTKDSCIMFVLAGNLPILRIDAKS